MQKEGYRDIPDTNLGNYLFLHKLNGRFFANSS